MTTTGKGRRPNFRNSPHQENHDVGERYEDEATALANRGGRGRPGVRADSHRAFQRKTPAGSQAGPRGQTQAARLKADVIATYGRHFLLVPRHDAHPQAAMALGRRLDCVVGDQVIYRQASQGPSAIESVAPRRNQIRRRDAFREKTIAANVDQAAILISGYPAFDEALLMRLLLALTAEDIPALVLVTKQDLVHASQQITQRTDCYARLGYPMLAISALHDPASLTAVQQHLVGKRTVLLGQSGMGKSTLLNALVPTAGQQTREISEALASGRHTTTFSRAFILPDGTSWLIDTPGFQQFELAHLSRWQLLHAMPEFRPYLGQCRFNDCQHRDEPGCAIRAAAQQGEIDPHRYALFLELADYH